MYSHITYIYIYVEKPSISIGEKIRSIVVKKAVVENL